MDKTFETRFNTGNKVEIRKTEEGEVYIEGRGIPFNVESDPIGGWFTERVLPEAVEGLDWGDVYSFVNHNPNNVMGRTKSGTMTIDVRNDGVYYSVKPPKAAQQFIENIERGDIDGSSFSFRIAPDGEVWEDRSDEKKIPLRTIKKFSIVKEMGAVVGPAYPQADASVAKRSLEEWRKSQEPEDGMDDATRMKGDLLKMREKDNVKL